MEQKVRVRMPLFDRLVDRSRLLHADVAPVRTLDRGGVRKSVRRELEPLFNTRCPIPSHRLGARERTVIDYGIPDFSTFRARNPDDQKKIAAILKKAIEAYEPRLADVKVTIEPIEGDDFMLAGAIEATLIVDNTREAVLFETMLQMKEGSVEVR